MGQSLVVWSALTKAVENDKPIADIVIGTKAPSEAWRILTNMVEDEDCERTREQAKKHFEERSINNAESIKEHIVRAKFLVLHVKYHGIEVTEQAISHRVLNGLSPRLCSRET